MEIPVRLNGWLEEVWRLGGSDLLLLVNAPVRVRVDGELDELPNESVLEAPEILEVVRGLLTDEQFATFETRGDADFAFSWGSRARVRGNAYHQADSPALALRVIPAQVPTLEEIGVPESVRLLIENRARGFVLVTGATGSGKSTTLASMINRINETRKCHIVTLEDPIEYIHAPKLAAVSQREIGRDAESFARALRAALREDPDVVLLGEMRDLESVEIALTLAETGHLVFATLHTNDAPQAIDRIVDAVPVGAQEQVRAQLAAALTAVIAQRLLPRTGGGRVAVFEVMIATIGVRNLIRERRSNQMPRIISSGSAEGMVSFNQSLAVRVNEGLLAEEEALRASSHPESLLALLRQGNSQ
jgi:twitching motility protein PilT